MVSKSDLMIGIIQLLEKTNALEDLSHQRSVFGNVLEKSFPLELGTDPAANHVDTKLIEPVQRDVLNAFEQFVKRLVPQFTETQTDSLGAVYNVSGAGKTKVISLR